MKLLYNDLLSSYEKKVSFPEENYEKEDIDLITNFLKKYELSSSNYKFHPCLES